jgi:mono/diheme cytochrome c family protein
MLMRAILAATTILLATPVMAADAVLDPITAAAKQADPSFRAFSAPRGEQVYRSKHAGAQHDSCAACHTADARKPGQHAATGKLIDPLAPSANPKRFTDAAKVEKWFRRNCKEVLSRECTALEKGDFVTYMRSIK